MRSLAVTVVYLCLTFASLGAQSEVDLMSIGRSLPLVTRAELEESLAWHRALVDSVGTEDSDGEKALEAITYIETRLELGDFRPGDQIVFYVEGEPTFPDTLIVEGGPSVLIPDVGTVSLDGILRSELQDHLARELARFIRDPIVRAQPTIRLTMGGTIGVPGFYTFPAEIPVGDAIMQAGGPTGNSRMGSINIKRDGLLLYGGEEVNLAIAQGRTFDQLGLRPGDEVSIPEKIFTVRRVVTMGIALATTLFFGFRLYGGGGGGGG